MDSRRDVDIKIALLIFLAGVAVILLPAFFLRLYSDEVIFWEVARNIAAGRGMTSETAGGGLFSWHMPLPFLVDAVFLRINQHIFVARTVSALFTAGSAAAVYLVARQLYDKDASTVSALLFLFSFHALRYGGRFYLDQYGVFFFLLSILFILRDKALLCGVFALLAVLAREYWLFIYPFLFFYARAKTKRPVVFISPLILSAAVLLAASVVLGDGYIKGVESYFTQGAMVKNLRASLGDALHAGLYGLARAWAEFAALNALALGGFIVWMATHRGREQALYLLVVLPQFIVISLIHGFAVDGGVTQYAMGLTATLCVFSGPGLKRLFLRLPLGGSAPGGFFRAMLLIVLLQFAALNILATQMSLHKSIGVYGFGYSDDQKVIDLLRKNAAGASINGIHGAFVDARRGWDWTDYRVDEAIAKEPDWMVTFSNYVDILPASQWSGRVELFTIGPYIVAHSVEKGSLKYALRQRDFRRWLLRKR